MYEVTISNSKIVFSQDNNITFLDDLSFMK